MTIATTLTREQSRRADRLAIEKYGVPGNVLMENAGRGAVDALLDVDPSPGPVVVMCGKGNNAGDGLVIARHLAIRGVEAVALLLFAPDELGGDVRRNYDILAKLGLPIADLSAPTDPLTDVLDAHAGDAAWLVDAMLGTGATGAPRSPLDSAVRWMNAQAARRLAVDVPSGLDCETGEASNPSVRADLTVTFVAPKIGFEKKLAEPWLGELRVADIGVPRSIIES